MSTNININANSKSPVFTDLLWRGIDIDIDH